MEILETVFLTLLGLSILLSSPFVLYVIYKNVSLKFNLSRKYGLAYFFKRPEQTSPEDNVAIEEFGRFRFIVWGWNLALILFLLLVTDNNII